MWVCLNSSGKFPKSTDFIIISWDVALNSMTYFHHFRAFPPVDGWFSRVSAPRRPGKWLPSWPCTSRRERERQSWTRWIFPVIAPWEKTGRELGEQGGLGTVIGLFLVFGSVVFELFCRRYLSRLGKMAQVNKNWSWQMTEFLGSQVFEKHGETSRLLVLRD